MSIVYTEGDILNSDAQIICVKYGDEKIKNVYPHAEFETKQMGKISVKGGKGKKWVCALYFSNDTECEECVKKISKIKGMKYLAFHESLVPFSLCEKYFSQKEDLKVEIVRDRKTRDAESKIPITRSDKYTWKNSNLLDFTRENIPQGWEDFFSAEIDNSIPVISEELKKAVYEVYPPLHLVYKTLDLVNLEDAKVLIIGQDPYHGKGQAMGISFSVNKGTALPPTLENIYKELVSCGYTCNMQCGDLTKWCEQGVLMLNTALTVKEHTPMSHSSMWENFTKSLFRFINKKCKPMVIIMWGSHAQRYSSLFTNNHVLIKSVHPSPFSANNGFFGSKPFTKANQYLKELERDEIDWSL